MVFITFFSAGDQTRALHLQDTSSNMELHSQMIFSKNLSLLLTGKTIQPVLERELNERLGRSLPSIDPGAFSPCSSQGSVAGLAPPQHLQEHATNGRQGSSENFLLEEPGRGAASPVLPGWEGSMLDFVFLRPLSHSCSIHCKLRGMAVG